MGTDERRDEPGPVVFGEVLFDHFPDGSRVLGGAPFNVAWHLQGLGRDPLFVSAVGSDGDGGEVLERMSRWGLDPTGVQRHPERPTGLVEVREAGGEPTFVIPPDQAWDHIEPDGLPDPDGAGVLYHGTLALRGPASRRAFRALASAAGAPALVDLNLRDPWWTPARVRRSLARARWAKLNAEELGRLAPGGGAAGVRGAGVPAAARGLAEAHGLHAVVVTLGPGGGMVVTDGRVYRAEAPDVEVVDTVGAGDAFSAVTCVGLLEGWAWDVVVRRANRFAAGICRTRGATTSDRALYDATLQEWEADA